jgi:thiol-disulfide isomerase/thioredoxin
MELRAPFAAAFLAGLFLLSCSRQDQADVEPAPAGIIQEIAADASVTTDVNARSPAFVRTAWDDSIIRTQDFIGERVILLDFWSVFCQSCIEEIPFLIELHNRYGDEGLEVISVNTDFFPKARVESFMKKVGMELPFTLIHDRDQSLSKLFGVDALPVTVLIDSSGWIRMVHLGYRPEDEKEIEGRVSRACRKIRETVVTLQPVEGKTAFSLPGGSTVLEAGAAVPDFALQDGQRATVPFSSARGSGPSMVFFWSLFCQPCREEMPDLVSLARRYGDRGLRAVAVNVDSEKLLPSAVRFSRKEAQGLDHYFDPPSDAGQGDAAEAFGVTYTPSLFLLDADGSVAFSASGKVPVAEIAGKLEELFAP